MDLNILTVCLERLRSESIGDPEWLPSKGVFEYSTQSVEVAAVLKLIRAGQGVHALKLLCCNGLFVDMGAIYRCVLDCTNEVHFLLENYPIKSSKVEKFLREFFSQTIDADLTCEPEFVQSNKIHNAVIRVITGTEQDEHAKQALSNVYKTFSGYTHAGYAHIMEMFGGSPLNMSFNIAGVPSQQERDLKLPIVQTAYDSVLLAIAFAAIKLGLNDLYSYIRQNY